MQATAAVRTLKLHRSFGTLSSLREEICASG